MRAASEGRSDTRKQFDFDLSNLPVDPVSTGAALAMVVGLFLLTVTALRRATPKSKRFLPPEVAAVLGRMHLGGKQVAHLLKMGSKLVLVHIGSDEVKTITEITDPQEVTRMLAMCEQASDHSATAAFREVFDKLASEPTEAGFLDGEPAPLIDRRKLADAYANTPGGRHAG